MVEPNNQFLTEYLYILRGRRRQLAFMVGLFFIISVLDLFGISLIGPFIALVTGQLGGSRFAFMHDFIDRMGGLKHFTLWFGSALAVIYVGKNFLAYKIFARTLKFGFKVRSEISMKLAGAYLAMPYKFYLERNSASLVQSVINDTKAMSDDLLIPSLRIVSDSIVVAMIFILLCLIDLRGVLISLILIGGSLAWYGRFVKPRARLAGSTTNQAFEQIIKRTTQSFWSVREIRILGVEKFFLNQMTTDVEAGGAASASYFAMMALPRYLMEAVVVIVVITLSLVSVLGGSDHQSVVPSLATFAAAGLRILPALVSISGAAASVHYSTQALHNVYRDLRLVNTYQPIADEQQVEDQRFEILSFEHAYFRHAGKDRDTLSDISFTIRGGESVGIIGATGAGKSTLIDAILGFHDVQNGQIMINGINIGDYGWNNWRNHVAYLPQTVAMLDDSIEANVAFGIPPQEIVREKVRSSLAAAQLDRLVDALPDGLMTLIGDRGARLSGGEKQRLALARAFYFDRDVIIMDEATSSLDTETERQVIDVIENLHGRKTLIIVAHRLNTISGCDKVFRLEGGRLFPARANHEIVEQRSNS